MKLDLKYLLTGTPIRMRFTRRWATSRILHPETVAEHSYFVCLYAMMVAKWVWHSLSGPPSVSWETFLGEVLEKAVLHDIEECRSGDIHRPFKHSTPELKGAMDVAALAAAKQVLHPMALGVLDADRMVHAWRTSKDSSIAGKIVRFCDFLAVVAFVAQEGKGASEGIELTTFLPHLEEFKEEKYDMIRPLVDQIEALVKEVLHGQ